MKSKTKLIFLAVLIFLIIFYLANQKMNENFVEINGLKIKVEIAKTPTEQARGLSNREILNDQEGMLFVYPDYKIRNFWMKKMQFSIDTIWISNDKIVGIEKNIPLFDGVDEEKIKRYQSPVAVNYVLEVNAGFSDKNNIKVGDRVKITYEN